jgi:hypothetical protein
MGFEFGNAAMQMVWGQMGIPHRHPHVLVSGQGGDFCKRDSRLDESANKRVAQGVHTDLLYSAGLGRTLQRSVDLATGIGPAGG